MLLHTQHLLTESAKGLIKLIKSQTQQIYHNHRDEKSISFRIIGTFAKDGLLAEKVSDEIHSDKKGNH